jgi:hypothetical protein
MARLLGSWLVEAHVTSDHEASLLQSLRRAVEGLVAQQAAHMERLERLDNRVEALGREHADTLRELTKSRFEAEEAIERLRFISEPPGFGEPASLAPPVPGASPQKPSGAESEISEIDVAGAVASGLGALIDAARRKRDELDRHIAQLQEALGLVTGSSARRPMRLPVAFEEDAPPEETRGGTVELQVAEPDPASLLRFEEALKRMPGVSDVRVRTAGRDQVIFQVTIH